MSLKTTGAFISSRYAAFLESPLRQRMESGLDITEYITLKRQVQAIQGKWGYIFPVDIGPNADYVAFASDTERVDWLMGWQEANINVNVKTPACMYAWTEDENGWLLGPTHARYSIGRYDWAFASATVTIVSTPDPGTGSGTFQTVCDTSFSPKSGYYFEPTPVPTGTGPNHHNIFAGFSWYVDSRSITYSESGITAYKKWTDGTNTVEITTVLSDPISNDDCKQWVQDLWNDKTQTLDDITDTQILGVYYEGASDTLTETTSPPFGGGFDTEHTPLFYGGGECQGNGTYTGTATWLYEYPICAMRDVEFAVKGQHADYTQINQFDDTLIDQTSEKLPYYPNEVRLRYLADPNNWGIDELTQKRPDQLTWYTTPTPDFPVPS